jgi:hypothetical protein
MSTISGKRREQACCALRTTGARASLLFSDAQELNDPEDHNNGCGNQDQQSFFSQYEPAAGGRVQEFLTKFAQPYTPRLMMALITH